MTECATQLVLPYGIIFEIFLWTFFNLRLGPFCGNDTIGELVVDGDHASVVFKSDPTDEFGGFLLNWQANGKNSLLTKMNGCRMFLLQSKEFCFIKTAMRAMLLERCLHRIGNVTLLRLTRACREY